MKQYMDFNEKVAYRYESVFCIFLVLLAYLWGNNANFVYPQILYLLVLLLTTNLAAGLSLRLFPSREGLATLIILFNCATITAILYYSGGPNSNLWVLYLLPIYTVCMLMGRNEVALVTFGVVSFNLCYYAYATTFWLAQILFELTLKCGIFIFTALAVWKITNKEKVAKNKLQIQRQEIKQLVEKIESRDVALKKTEKMAEIGLLISGVAHDLNNPLAVILGTVDILLAEGALSSGLRPDIEQIKKSAEFCKDIVLNLLNSVRNKDTVFSATDVNEILESAVYLYKSTLAKSRIRIENKYSKELPRVMANPADLQRVFLNLIGNARYAMKDGGILTIQTTQDSALSVNNLQWIEVTVEDTGPGIPPHLLDKLFQPFVTTKPVGEGTGLGLYLSQQIANKHGGNLTAENKPGSGARFILKLPVQLPQAIHKPLALSPQRSAI